MAEDERWKDYTFFRYVMFKVILSIIVALLVINFFFNFTFGRTMFYSDWLWGVFVFIVFIWVISWMFRSLFYHEYWGHNHEMRILRRRLARGDISEAEFKRKMKILRESHKNE